MAVLIEAGSNGTCAETLQLTNLRNFIDFENLQMASKISKTREETLFRSLKKIIGKTTSNNWKILEEIIKEHLQEGICEVTASVDLLKIEDVNFAMQ